VHKKTRSYTKEFKEEAIKLALKSKSIVEAANDLGIPSGTLHGWVKYQSRNNISQPQTMSANKKDKIDDLYKTNRELQKRIARLEEEKAILKKAAAYFAKEIG
jgi:transposase